MGLFDTLGGIAKEVGKGMVEKAERMQEEKDKAYENGQRMSDRQLVKKFQSASGMKKIGYALVLEERGYYTRNSEGKLVRTSKRLD